MSKNKINVQQNTTKASLGKTLTISSPKNSQFMSKNRTVKVTTPKTVKHNISQDKVQDNKSNSIPKQSFKLPTPTSKSKICNFSNPKGDDIELELQNKIRQLNQKLKKMYAYIDLFNLIYYDDKVIRCLEHNNILTLYCTNERKILCVNCTYGITKHRMHKVLPLKNCIHYVNQDNELLRDILHKDLVKLQKSYENNEQNIFLLQRQYNRHMEQLDEDFKKRLEGITSQYERDKQKIEQNYKMLLNGSRKITEGLNKFKHNVWDTLSKIEIQKGVNLIPSDVSIMRQVFCVHLSEFTHLQVKKITNRQIQRLGCKVRN